MKTRVSIVICIFILCLVGCSKENIIEKKEVLMPYEEEIAQEDIVEKVSENEWNQNIDKTEMFISESSQIELIRVSKRVEKTGSDYFGVWNECLPVFPEDTEIYINIEDSLRLHADEAREEFEKGLEEWISYVNNMDDKKLESHMEWIRENGLVIGDFTVEEVHYQGDQYIAFLIKCGTVENITPPREYRYKMFSYNLETGQEMTLSYFKLEKNDWNAILEEQYMSLCEQYPETYEKKYIEKIIEGFNPEAVEEYENDLYFFTDEGIMFYFNRSITNDEKNTDFNASSDYPGISWERMKLYNHILISYENILK